MTGVRWLAGVLALWLAIAPSPAASFTDAARVRAVYDLILDARFDRAGARLMDTCPPLPTAVCQALGAASLWWQILINPDNRTLDAAQAR